MRKARLLLTVMMLLMAMSASARFNAAKQDAPKAYFGLRVGVGGSTYYNIKKSEALVTPIGGVAIGVKVAKLPLYLESGAYYQNMGSRFEDSEYWWHYGYYDEVRHSHVKKTFKVNNHSVIVPLVVTYHFYASDNITIQPFVGLYGAYGFDNKKTDFGLREGVGFSFGHLFVNLGANIGLIEQDIENNNTWVEGGQHLSLFLGVGFNF